MDYRLTAIRDTANSHREYCANRATELRNAQTGSRDANPRMEITISREQGKAEAYQWIVDQFAVLDSVQLPPPGGVKESQTASGDHRPIAGGCSICLDHLDEARKAFERMVTEANGYGWSDSDCQRARERLDTALRDLQRNLPSHLRA